MYKLNPSTLIQAEIAAHDPAESTVVVEVYCFGEDGPRAYVVIRDDSARGLTITPPHDRDTATEIASFEIAWPGLRQEFVAAFPAGRNEWPREVERWLIARGLIPQDFEAPIPLLDRAPGTSSEVAEKTGD